MSLFICLFIYFSTFILVSQGKKEADPEGGQRNTMTSLSFFQKMYLNKAMF